MCGSAMQGSGWGLKPRQVQVQAREQEQARAQEQAQEQEQERLPRVSRLWSYPSLLGASSCSPACTSRMSSLASLALFAASQAQSTNGVRTVPSPV